MKSGTQAATAGAAGASARAGRQVRCGALLAGLLPIGGLAFLTRSLYWRSVFKDAGTQFFEGDCYYHMWQIWQIVRNFPHVPGFDPYLNFPHGGETPLPPGFDLTLAALIRVVVGREDAAAAEQLAAWVPVALSIGTVIAVGWFGARVAGTAAGLVAAFLLAVLPAGVQYSRLGFVDHHAAVALLSVLLLGGGMQLVARRDAGPRGWPLVAGGLAASMLLVWPGCLIHIALVQLATLAWSLEPSAGSEAPRRAARLALAHALAAAALAPYAVGRSYPEFGSFTPLAITSFQPVYFALAAGCLGATALLWAKTRAGADPRLRIAAALAVGAVGLLAAFLAIPELSAMLDRSAGWFRGDERFHLRIRELRPLLSPRIGASPGPGERAKLAITYFGVMAPAFPIALLVLARAVRSADRRLLVLWAVVFAALALDQARFVNSASPAYALVWGVVLADAVRWVAVRCRTRPTLRWGAVAVAGALLASVAAFTVPYYRQEWATGNSWYAKRIAAFSEASRFVRAYGPPVEGPDGLPQYGVLSAWGLGHQVRYESRRPVVQDGFGPYLARENVEAANRYFDATDESLALEILDAYKARFVLVDRLGAGIVERRLVDSMTTRMTRFRGSQKSLLRKNRLVYVPALVGHRMVFETDSSRGPLRVFERVEGAVVRGRAEPGASVRASLLLLAPLATFHYTNRVVADADGEYEITLPYPTEAFGAAVTPQGPYHFDSGGNAKSLHVPESAVRAGLPIEGPSFPAHGPETRPHAGAGDRDSAH